MNSTDMYYFLPVFLAMLGLSFLFSRQTYPSPKRYQTVIFKTAIFAPSFVLAVLVLVLFEHMIRVSSGADAVHLYIGVVSSGTPYVGHMQDQTPTLYAIHRAVLHALGGNDLQLLTRVISFGNYISLSIMFACLAMYWVKLKKESSNSLFTIAALLCVIIAGMLLVARNIEVKNSNIWMAGPVAFFLTADMFRKRWSYFFGGMALGIAFMIKPCFPIVILLLLFCSVRRRRRTRNLLLFTGVVSAGVIGFCASLLAPGIDIHTYHDFLFHALPVVYQSSQYHDGMFMANLSLLKYVPAHGVSILSLVVTCVFGAAAFFYSRSSDRSLPWFFITLLFSPILWNMHLMAVFPAFVVLVMKTEDGLKQLANCASIVMAIASAIILNSAIAVNACLLLVWLVEVLPYLATTNEPLIAIEEAKPFGEPEPVVQVGASVA